MRPRARVQRHQTALTANYNSFTSTDQTYSSQKDVAPVMGVVRREGDWRLEKKEEGFYEITYQREPQEKVITPDYREPQFGASFDMLPTHKVDSYAEAEGLFEEKAHGPNPVGFGGDEGLIEGSSDGLLSGSRTSQPLRSRGSSGSTDELEDIDAPPGLIAIAAIIVGGFVAWSQGFAPNSSVFQIGILFVLVGLGIFGWGGLIYRTDGWRDSVEFLFNTESSRSSSGSTASTEKTPPAPEHLKNELIFDRANHHCEWCGERFDNLHVHHIEPRKEGGPNSKRNLIALCPNCHDRADRGGISKTKLKGKVRQIMAKG